MEKTMTHPDTHPTGENQTVPQWYGDPVTPGYGDPVTPGYGTAPHGAPSPPGYRPPSGYQPPGRPDRPRRRVTELCVVALLAAALASGGTVAATRYVDGAPVARPVTSSSSAPANPAAPVLQANGSAPDWAATAKSVGPSVVSIAVSGRQASGQGSGVILDKSGHVLTNNHVATGAGTSATISVVLSDGRSYAAKVVGTDPSTDLAVLSIDGAPGDLTPISTGDSSTLAVGEPVMAIGNPLGLAGTVTTGIISALNRPVSTGAAESPTPGAGGAEPVVTNAIQTSAAINPGNSGGALVTANGQLIGINSSIASLGSTGGSQSGNIGIGFAIPSNEAKSIADQLIASGRAQHAFLGVTSADTAAADGSAKRAAALIKAVSPGTPAAKGGLRADDAVIAIDGRPIDGSLSLVASVRERNVGDTATLTILRGGSRQDITVTLVARPAQGQ